MILDHLTNASLYQNLSPRIAQGLAALRTANLHLQPDGRYEIDGSRLFALVQRYDTKPAEQGKWESHRKYIDIQYLAQGTEVIGIAPLTQMTVTQPYSDEKDVQFLAGHGDKITLSAGMFAIFFPHDVHMPTLAVAQPEAVLKVVLKIAID